MFKAKPKIYIIAFICVNSKLARVGWAKLVWSMKKKMFNGKLTKSLKFNCEIKELN